MPSLSRITSTFFVTLINRLGVRPPPAEGFALSNVVQPVSIVDSDIALTATSTSLNLDTPFTAGLLAAPLAAVVLADTGQLPAGNWSLFIMIGVDTTAGGGISCQLARRNAANAADVWGQQIGVLNTGDNNVIISILVTVLLNERIRIITTANTLGFVQANIWARQVA